MKKKLNVILFLSLLSVAFIPMKAPVSYWVATTGNDQNFGTQGSPYRTIQHCLNIIKVGDTCNVESGIYHESLTLKAVGIKGLQTTLKCTAIKTCTVNSGNARSLITSGQQGYYTIDGFKFISTLIDVSHPSKEGTVNLSYNFWGGGFEAETGNDGFILRNCYIEGSVWIYGSDNTVENCEFNGKGIFSNGLMEGYQPSENNTFQNNLIHDYKIRGGWSLQMTRNTLWEGNTVYNIGDIGLNCDGAGSAVFNCRMMGNTIYNVSQMGVQYENGFDGLIENNIIRDSRRGISVINYNKENGDGFNADKDYKGLMTNTIIKNNLIHNIQQDGLLCKAVRGNQFVSNTVNNVDAVQGYFGAIALAGYNGFYCPDWVIKNNIVSDSLRSTIWYEGNVTVAIDRNFYDVFNANIFNVGSRTFAQWQAMGKEANSKIGNPMFVNAAAGDFRLQSNSPACGSGAFPCGVVIITATMTVPMITSTRTITRTPTPTKTVMPSSTPTLSISIMCAQILWDRGLSIRATPSLFSPRLGIYDWMKIVVIEGTVSNSEGLWAKTNRGQYFALDLASNNIVYAQLIACQ